MADGPEPCERHEEGELIQWTCPPAPGAVGAPPGEPRIYRFDKGTGHLVEGGQHIEDLSSIPRMLVPLLRTYKVNVLKHPPCAALPDRTTCNQAACFWKSRVGRGYRDYCMELEEACQEEDRKNRSSFSKDGIRALKDNIRALGQKELDVQALQERCGLTYDAVQEHRRKRRIAGATAAAAAAAGIAAAALPVSGVGAALSYGARTAYAQAQQAGSYVADQAQKGVQAVQNLLPGSAPAAPAAPGAAPAAAAPASQPAPLPGAPAYHYAPDTSNQHDMAAIEVVVSEQAPEQAIPPASSFALHPAPAAS